MNQRYSILFEIKMKSLLAIIFIFSTLFFGTCKPETCEEIVPQIEFVSLQVFGDTAKLTFSFKDCDGDFGLRRSDTLPPYEYNVFIEYFDFNNGEFKKVGPLNPPFYYRIPFLESSSNSDILEGEIDIDIIPYYLPGFGDTMRYEVYIQDSLLHQSNVLTTPSLIAPQ